MSPNALPRWRGFNLLEMAWDGCKGDFREDDFRWIAEWGFNFVRIPLSYWLWIGDTWRDVHEGELDKIDRVVELGRQYGIHVNLAFHRAPGYCVAPKPVEPFNLWKDDEAAEAFCFHWQLFARRYRGIDSERLSFNLVNEPNYPDGKTMTRADHERVIRQAVQTIRAIDPERLIIADGLLCGNEPSPELADLGIAQSCRAYAPMGVTHYQAPWTFEWMDPATVPEPAWPGGWNPGGARWTRDDLEKHYAPWRALMDTGVGVHCGEGGIYCHTAHDVTMRWFADLLSVLKEANIGWALWNFRGGFGVLDSQRKDVAYEDWHGHQLDRELLEVLRAW